MSETITRDEWLDEFERVMSARTVSGGMRTAEEIGRELREKDPKWVRSKVDRYLREMFLANRLVSGKELRPAKDGSMRPSPVYSFKA